jgi:hypothetical protein
VADAQWHDPTKQPAVDVALAHTQAEEGTGPVGLREAAAAAITVAPSQATTTVESKQKEDTEYFAALRERALEWLWREPSYRLAEELAVVLPVFKRLRFFQQLPNHVVHYILHNCELMVRLERPPTHLSQSSPRP